MTARYEMDKKLGALAYTGTPEERELAWYQAGGATSSVLPEARRQFLDTAGFSSGVLTVDWYNYLGAQGHSGTINEREIKFWQNL